MSADTETYYASLTPSAVQVRWKVPTEFPSCPPVASDNGLEQYASDLAFGSVFGENQYSTSIVVDYRLAQSGLIVLTRFTGEPIKDWAVAHVSIQNGRFLHRSEHTFYELKGALKHFCTLTGESYEESFDDYA